MSKQDPQLEAVKEIIDPNNKDTYSYRGWLVSDKFYKRMLAIWGYTVVGTFISYGLIILLLILFGEL